MFELVICLGLSFSSCNISPPMSKEQCDEAIAKFTFPTAYNGIPVIAYCRQMGGKMKGQKHV